MRAISGTFLDGAPLLTGHAPAGHSIRAIGQTFSDSLYRTSALTGVTAGKTGIFSIFFRFAADAIIGQAFVPLQFIAGLNGGLPDAATDRSFIVIGAGPTTAGFGIELMDAAVANYVTAVFDEAANFNAAWHHVIFAWDVNHASGTRVVKMAFDGVLLATSFVADVGSAFNVGTNTTAVMINGQGYSGGSMAGTGEQSIAEVYANLGETIDITTPSNIAKFRNPATGKPENLGSDGSTPTGTAPAIYLSVADGAAASTFLVNKGTGGNFTATRTPQLATTDPF